MLYFKSEIKNRIHNNDKKYLLWESSILSNHSLAGSSNMRGHDVRKFLDVKKMRRTCWVKKQNQTEKCYRRHLKKQLVQNLHLQSGKMRARERENKTGLACLVWISPKGQSMVYCSSLLCHHIFIIEPNASQTQGTVWMLVQLNSSLIFKM